MQIENMKASGKLCSWDMQNCESVIAEVTQEPFCTPYRLIRVQVALLLVQQAAEERTLPAAQVPSVWAGSTPHLFPLYSVPQKVFSPLTSHLLKS